MYIKEFDKWNVVKRRINEKLKVKVISIREGEIRWISCGVNVGSEIDGKGHSFARPALILHVVGSHLALVIPMSTKIKELAGYSSFEFKGRHSALCLHQIRTVSQQRILGRMGKISDSRLTYYKRLLCSFHRLI